MSKWLVAMPYRHPKWPRYCHRCGDLAAGCVATKTISVAVAESYVDVATDPRPVLYDPSNYSVDALVYERRIIPAKPAMIVNFYLTACIECRVFIISKKDKNSKHIGGIYGAVRAAWGMRIVVVNDYR